MIHQYLVPYLLIANHKYYYSMSEILTSAYLRNTDFKISLEPKNADFILRKYDMAQSQRKRIFIAEDHPIFRDGLRAMFNSLSDYEVVGEAEDGIEALRCVEKFKPDLVVLDLSMPRMNGLKALKEIKERFPATKVLILTIHDSKEYVVPALRTGADGYILKTDTQADLLKAIKSIFEGKRFVSPGISQ